MFKRVFAACLCLAMVVTLVPAIAVISEPEVADAAPYVMPSHGGTTNNVTYTLGAGTDAEVPVYVDWRSTSKNPTQSITPEYVMVHNTGTYVSTATAKNVHNNTNKTSTSACWHYTVDSYSIYQGLSDTRRGWHSATSYTYLPSNLNSIGIEMCVNNFPATETFGGEQWTDGDAIMAWWKNEFDQTMKNTAYLCVVLCERWGLNWQTDIVTHWDAWQYSVSGKSGKDCPMQMRATYDPATNQFKQAGTYADGRDGYFWQMFWGYVEAYANGATSVDGNTYTSAAKIGTYQITPSDGLNVRAGVGTSYDIIGVLEMGTIVETTELSGNWGKVTLEDGTEGWCNIVDYGTYIGIDAQAYNTAPATSGVSYSYDSDGSLTLVNNSSEQGQFDMLLPQKIGTATTPFMSLQVNPLSGSGYYFGITQQGSGYWMMRDCESGDQLVNETTAPYMTGLETLQIDIRDWWVPEEDYQIDQVRFYLAPNTSIKINYFYFAATSGTVTDTRYNLMSASTNVTLMQPDTIAIGDMSKAGSYVYSNGMLTVTADTAAGFDVVFNLNETFDVNVMKRLLVGVEAHTTYNISILVTNANGEGWVTLVADFWPSFAVAAPTDGYLPAWEGTAGLDLYNYYDYNNVIPTDGMSTVKQVKISLGSAGTSYFNAVQIAENDRILLFRDGVYTEGSSDGTVEPEPTPDPTPDPTPGVIGDVNSDGEVSTVDARLIISHLIGTVQLTEEQLAVADYDNDGEVSTADVRTILSSLLV